MSKSTAVTRFGPDTLGVGLAVLLSVPAWLYPFGNDQALHWYVGQGLLAGQLPFVDAISGKPLGIFIVHALASALLPFGQAAIRLAELPTLLGIALLLRRLLHPPTAPAAPRGSLGTLAVLVVGTYYVFFDYWDTAHPELWEALLLLGAADVASRVQQRWLRPLATGALCGAAFMFKYPAATIALPIAARCGLRAMAPPMRPAARLLALNREAVLYLLGALLVFAAAVLPYALTGTLSAMREVLVTLLMRYAGQAGTAPPGPGFLLLGHGGGLAVAAGLGLCLGVASALWRRDVAQLWVGLWWLLLTGAAMASVVLQRRYFAYHFVVVHPFMAGAVYYGLHGGGELWARRAQRQLPGWFPVLTATALVGLALVAGPRWCTNPEFSYRAHIRAGYAYLQGERSRAQFLRPFLGYNFLDHYTIHEHIGRAVARRAQPTDELCVRGFAPAIYEVAGLRCPSRHVMQPFPAGLPRWEIEFFAALRRQRPRFVVTFEDRHAELQLLRDLGYTAHDMPSLYVLMEASPAARPPKHEASPPAAPGSPP